MGKLQGESFSCPACTEKRSLLVFKRIYRLSCRMSLNRANRDSKQTLFLSWTTLPSWIRREFLRGNDSFRNDVPLAAYSMGNSTFGIVRLADLVTVLGRSRSQIEIKHIPDTRTRDTIYTNFVAKQTVYIIGARTVEGRCYLLTVFNSRPGYIVTELYRIPFYRALKRDGKAQRDWFWRFTAINLIVEAFPFASWQLATTLIRAYL